MNIIVGVTGEGRRRAWVERGDAIKDFVNLTVPDELSPTYRAILWDHLDALKFRQVPDVEPLTRYLPGYQVDEVPTDMDGWIRFIAGLAVFVKEREELAQRFAKAWDSPEPPGLWQCVKSALFGHE